MVVNVLEVLGRMPVPATVLHCIYEGRKTSAVLNMLTLYFLQDNDWQMEVVVIRKWIVKDLESLRPNRTLSRLRKSSMDLLRRLATLYDLSFRTLLIFTVSWHVHQKGHEPHVFLDLCWTSWKDQNQDSL